MGDLISSNEESLSTEVTKIPRTNEIKDNSNQLIGKTMEEATDLIKNCEDGYYHNGKLIKELVESDSIIRQQGLCYVNIKDGKIYSIYRNF